MPRKRDPIESELGSRLKQSRTLAGMSQTALGEKLGVSFQQIQKYEMGANRISASRLYRISRLLGLPLNYFFEGGDKPMAETPKLRSSATSHDGLNGEVARRETLELVRAYQGIADEKSRLAVRKLIRTLAHG